MNRQRGFTLIELLVVIAIIALLMGILMPVLRSAREQARKAICLAHVKSLITGIHVYAVDYDGNIPASIDGMTELKVCLLWYHRRGCIAEYPRKKGNCQTLDRRCPLMA